MGSKIDSDTLKSRVTTLAQDIDSLAKDVAQNEEQRKQLFGVIMGAMAKVELPIETVWRMIMSPHAPAALMVLIRAGVVTSLVAANKPQTATSLASTTGASSMLIIRMMRPLCALGVFKEVDVHTYQSTAISQTLATAPPLLGGYQFMFDLATRSLANLPRYLEKTGFQHVDSAPGPFQDCNNTDDGMFPYLIKHPDMMGNFNDFMSGSIATRPNWFTAFPALAEEIVAGGGGAGGARRSTTDDDDDGEKKPEEEEEPVLFIDVAGGSGHDVSAFHHAFPFARGKLILQDLPPVIDDIVSLDPNITRCKHDFFTPQPISAARTYYFRNIFHDWPDASCVQILRHTAEAMKRGYSKLLIFEWVLPDRDVPLYPALLDVNMMAVLNGRERTEGEWRALLGEAGLRVVKVHVGSWEAEGVIEAELAD